MSPASSIPVLSPLELISHTLMKRIQTRSQVGETGNLGGSLGFKSVSVDLFAVAEEEAEYCDNPFLPKLPEMDQVAVKNVTQMLREAVVEEQESKMAANS
jgi:hypothetical protein